MESGIRKQVISTEPQRPRIGRGSSPKENEVEQQLQAKRTESWEGINNIWPLPPWSSLLIFKISHILAFLFGDTDFISVTPPQHLKQCSLKFS